VTVPVEIKELVIRAVVQKDGAAKAEPSDPTAQAVGSTRVGEEERAAIVSAAVREVLRILKAAKER
jgi:hypothetical protein